MGCGFSRYGPFRFLSPCCPCCFRLPSLLLEVIDRDLETFQVLGLYDTELFTLWTIFNDVDRDMTGLLTLPEFFSYCDLEESALVAKRAFSLFDIDASGKVDFCEFVTTLYNYCTFSRNALMQFAFDLYDLDGNGSISSDEIRRILLEVYGEGKREAVEREAQKVERVIGVDGRKVARRGRRSSTESPALSIRRAREQFRDFVEHHSAVLMPVYTLQRRLQERCGGPSFWRKIAIRRETRARNGDHRVAFDAWKSIVENVNNRRNDPSYHEKRAERRKRARRLEDMRKSQGCCGPRATPITPIEPELTEEEKAQREKERKEAEEHERILAAVTASAPPPEQLNAELKEDGEDDGRGVGGGGGGGEFSDLGRIGGEGGGGEGGGGEGGEVSVAEEEQRRMTAKEAAVRVRKAARRASMTAALGVAAGGGGVLAAAAAAQRARRRRVSMDAVSEEEKARARKELEKAARGGRVNLRKEKGKDGAGEDFPFERRDRTAEKMLEKMKRGQAKAKGKGGAVARVRRRRASIAMVSALKDGRHGGEDTVIKKADLLGSPKTPTTPAKQKEKLRAGQIERGSGAAVARRLIRHRRASA